MVLQQTQDTTGVAHKFGEVLRDELSGVNLDTYDDQNWDNLIMRLRDKGINITNADFNYKDDPSG